jgi:hypothetical protein
MLHNKEASGLLDTLVALLQPQYQMNRRLGRPQSQYRHFWRRKNLLPLQGFKPWTIQPVA